MGSTEKMAVKKFVKANFSKTMFLKRKEDREQLDLLRERGYTVISNIKESAINHRWVTIGPEVYIGYNQFKIIDLWCNEVFKPKHWMYIHDHWIFTKADDATLFKLTWL